MLIGLLGLAVLVLIIVGGLDIVTTRLANIQEKNLLLEDTCTKLANHILWLEHDPNLGGEMSISVIPNRVKSLLPPKNQVDLLLDALETTQVTGIKGEASGYKKADRWTHGFNSLVTLEFGTVAIRDMVPHHLFDDWNVDLIWRGQLMAMLDMEQQKRVRRIFSEKMAEAAIIDLEK